MRIRDELNAVSGGRNGRNWKKKKGFTDRTITRRKSIKIVIKQLLIALYSSSILVACAATEPDSDRGEDLTDTGSDCISIRTIRDYTALDRNSLIVEASGRRLYYVTLSMPSHELRSSFRVGVESRDERLCPYGGDRLVFDGLGSSINIGSNIRGIQRITPEQAEELLYRYGKLEQKEQPDPVPQELEGAEVEELGEVG
jgi:hypothetical protein